MHADGDSLAALAVISTIVQGVAIAAFPKSCRSKRWGFSFQRLFWASLQCVGEEDTRFPD